MLEAQRKKASFNKKDLSHLIYGGKEGHQRYLQYQNIVDNDPILRFDPSFLHQSRHDMMEVMAQKLLRFHSYHRLFPAVGSMESTKLHFLTYATPLSLHTVMFLTTLDNLCDEEQRKRIYEPAVRGEILGCYAQTQLAHGSDIQRLQTTATYDKSNETFIINTPSTSAAKWWIGDLGVHCTHAALFAQLIIDNKNYGLHAFLVPIRDPVTFKPLPGVEVGDIGPKLGFTTKDNGYVIFKDITIPRKNMLMKFHVVSKEGKYSLQGDQKISYATMLLTRSAITTVVSNKFSKIVTIGTRYSLLRRQFKNQKGQEIPVLEYQTQQAKIISRIGECYAFLFTARNINQLSLEVYNQAKFNNKFDRLNQAHILTSATKAYLTMESLNNAQVVRRSAGGHGFHMYSGMIGVQHQLSPTLTLQGEFTILMLQVARFLFKNLVNLQKGKTLPPSIQYLEELKKGDLTIDLKDQKSLGCPHFVNKILKSFACISIKNMGLKLSQGIKEGLTEKQAWDTYAGLTLVDASIAHSIYTIHTFYLKEIKKIECPKLKAVIIKLSLLYGLEKIIERASRVFQTGILTPQAFQMINAKRQSLFDELRPEALTLMEAFDYSDNTLQSAIAHSNERPYENLINWARRYNTVNRPEERSQIIDSIKKAKSELRPAL